MSSNRTRFKELMSIDQERGITMAGYCPDSILVTEDSANSRVLGVSILLLIASGIIVMLVGIITSIWPVILAGFGPLLLALVDTYRQRQERKCLAN